MSIWAIVPVKPLRRGKSRLAGVLSEDERAQLNIHMLERTLNVLKSIPEVEQILVVSRDPAALTIARSFNAKTVQEDGAPHLNTALRRAAAVAGIYSASGLLILPADLPLLTSDDIQQILIESQQSPVVTIIPDRHKDGTNALFQSPPGQVDFAFGPGSFTKHCERARKVETKLQVLEIPSMGLDLDLPEDLEILHRIEVDFQETHISIP